MSYKMVIVVRKDLNMRKGKLAAQVGHAVQGSIIQSDSVIQVKHIPHIAEWISGGSTKIVVSVDSVEELRGLEMLAKYWDLPHYPVKDLGRTEFKGVDTYTALAIGPGASDDIDKLTKELPLI